MAEQDKPTLVPAVLNDLVDVDGTAAEGDGLAYTSGAWRPGPAAGLLPANGPALTFFQVEVTSAGYADDTAIYNAYLGATPGVASGYEDWPAAPANLGTWGHKTASIHSWVPDEPGIYEWHMQHTIAVSAAPHAAARLSLYAGESILSWWIWTAHYEAVGATQFTPYSGPYRVQRDYRGTLYASQEFIDSGFCGLVLPPSPAYSTAGAERVTMVRSSLGLYRHTPGSAVNYFDQL